MMATVHALNGDCFCRCVPGLDKGKGPLLLLRQVGDDDVRWPSGEVQHARADGVRGLCQRHAVSRDGAPFASGLLRAIGFLRRNWEQLAADIDAGVLGSGVTDPSVREAVAGVLRRPPAGPRARRFRPRRVLQGRLGRPHRAHLAERQVHQRHRHRLDGAVRPGARVLRRRLAGRLRRVRVVGVLLRRQPPTAVRAFEVSYTFMPDMAYFEFLPADAAAGTAASESASRRLVGLAGVEAGREYEAVVTTFSGLYRCRVGDVLRAARFHNAAPRFRFVRRGGALLSVDTDGDGVDEAELQPAVERAAAHAGGALLSVDTDGDGVDEAELQRAVERAARPGPLRHLPGAAAAAAAASPGHYVIYCATDTDGVPPASAAAAARCCLEMEEALNAVYREHRARGGLVGPLEIRVVRPGTFKELADRAVAGGGAPAGEYKVPRCVTGRGDVVRLLDSRVVSCHFSPALPRLDDLIAGQE
ncbi:hypothetical protein ACP4OV_014490 [Aristida adscensionis]